MKSPLDAGYDRRQFIKVSSAAALGAMGATSLQAQEKKKLRVAFIGVGNRGAKNVNSVMSHPAVEAYAFCDVNVKAMDGWKKKYPKAHYELDYRKLFKEHADQFDAVVISTPDHMHAPILLKAMAMDKHVYAEKPLLHQLDELRMVRKAIAAKPHLVTQMGNQRSCSPLKMQFVELLRSGALGEIKGAWVWSKPMSASKYFIAPNLDAYPVSDAPSPANGAWNKWLGCSKEDLDFHPGLFDKKWRACWEFGSGMMGDWTPHLVDAVVYGMDLKQGPKKAITLSQSQPHKVTFGQNFHSKLTFDGVKASGGKEFVVHVTDGEKPKAADYHFPEGLKFGANQTMIDTEAGTLISTAAGKGWNIYKDGKSVKESLTMPKTTVHHHWHDWVANCLGAKKHLWSPFETGCLITELSLLPAKLTAFPNTEVDWNSSECRFSNHDEANAKVVSREYREGFGVPSEFS
ncbi:Gfo/Idh/MocA family oxidoreductase [Verrucomicrobiaceae bacterium R5-34]|nr:Gfo/Idh/MocA family oxidoreductase [Verrucomicrobiaceae bacterium R5-34]